MITEKRTNIGIHITAVLGDILKPQALITRCCKLINWGKREEL